ncbi:MAG: zf-HC2 domain-containing protein [Candidatus Latescibacteria bacterium]|jgi:hypothetical protein|nr:zf-HC2 domain-containing protein [Candidatus Latescibacterota bacterium]MDP7238611.1 zf-HC2 domain-containing protein [Candidatus Latescibacterota bacterium]
MACKSIQRLLHEAFERTLTSEEQKGVDGHLGACEVCHADAFLLKMVVQAVETTPVAQPSEAFTVRVMDHLPMPIRLFGFIPMVVFRSVMIPLGVVTAILIWVYRTALISSVKAYSVFDVESSQVLLTLQQTYASIQAMVGSAIAYLPVNQIISPEENPFVSVAIAIGVAIVILRMVNGFEPLEMDAEYSG